MMANDSGFFDNPALLDTLTTRGRAAYYLAVTESIFAAIPLDDEGRCYAREAIKLAWQWVGGAPVEGDDLYRCVENQYGTGVTMFPREKGEKRLAAWGAVCMAIMYVTWRAWKSEGRDDNNRPQTMESVDETWLLELHRYAEGTGMFDRKVARRLLDYLQANYPASMPNELGGPIPRAPVITAGGGASIGDVKANDSGILDNPSLLWSVTIRARVAYYLAIAEGVFAAILPDDEHRNDAIEAMNLAWQWVAGAAVEGDDIYEYFDHGDDRAGLVRTIARVEVASEDVYGWVEKGDTVLAMFPLGTDTAWRAVCTAIMYAIWQVYKAEGRHYQAPQAYKAEGQKCFPRTIELVDDNDVLALHDWAKSTGRFDHEVARRLLDYLQTNYPVSKPNELGGPIPRAGVIAAGGGRSIDA